MGTATIAPTTVCPTCHEPVMQPRIGRPRTYCSADCRREMYALVAELSELERQLAETIVLARNAHNEHWRRRYERTVGWLRLAIVEARSRIPEAMQ